MSVSKHKEWVRDIFNKCASDYGNGASAFFNDFGKAFVLRSKVEPGMRVLDVACGKGAVLFPLAEVVGKEGEVIGIDLSANMISELKKDSRLTPMPWVKVKKMDAEKMDFPNNSFDMIFCGFALFFFPNVAKALSEFMRTLKPKGTLHISIWGKKPEMVRWLVKESNKMCVIKTLSANSVNSKERLYEVLTEASFENVKITTDNKSFLYPVDEWWEGLPSHGIRARLEQLSEKQLEELKKKAFEELKMRGFTSRVLEEFEGVYAEALKPLN